MWTGMLLTCNLAMLLLSRAPCPVNGRRGALTLLLSNAGMALGMLLGGEAATEGARLLAWPAGPTSLLGMTIGMALGMLVGHWLLSPRSEQPNAGIA